MSYAARDSDVAAVARRRARFGGKNMLIWRTSDGVTMTSVATKENVKRAMKDVGVYGHFALYTAYESTGSYINWRLAVTLLRSALLNP